MQITADEFSLSPEEFDFLKSRLLRTDTVWEWGCGATTTLFSYLCRKVTSVEHHPIYAARAVLGMIRGSSVLYVPPDLAFDAASQDDGDGDTFRSYVESYTGAGVDVVFIDGRARVACARRVAETAPHGPHPEMKVFLHDWERPEYEPIWREESAPGAGDAGYLRRVETVGRLMLLEARL